LTPVEAKDRGAPAGVDVDAVEIRLRTVPGALRTHDLHL
jgi:hypothetical protein